MRKSIIVLFLITLLSLAPIDAQDGKPKAVNSTPKNAAPITLEAEETKQIAEAVKGYSDADAAYQRAEAESLNARQEALIVMGANCNLKTAYLQRQLAMERVERIQERQRAKYQCGDCSYSPDFKLMVRSQVPSNPK